MLTQASDADPFIVCAIPDHPGDLDPRTIEAAYEDDAHYLGTLPAEYHLDIEQRELTKHPPAVGPGQRPPRDPRLRAGAAL